MKPEILTPCFASVHTLPGIGPKTAQLFERLGCPRILDVCYHLPVKVVNRKWVQHVSQAQVGDQITFEGVVTNHVPPKNPRQPFRVHIDDGDVTTELSYFKASRAFVTKLAPLGARRLISGRLEMYNNMYTMSHPDFVGECDQRDRWLGGEVVYPLTAGLTSKNLGYTIQRALAKLPPLPEWLDLSFVAKQGWPGWNESLRRLHGPKTESDLGPQTPARLRLAYDELLASQITLSLARRHYQKGRGQSIVGDGRLRRAALERLPFSLTQAQVQALDEIDRDMAAPERMLRLLQGDVGSGKTVVAFLSMLTALEAGHQAALLAPTEILARQHFATIEPLARALGLEARLITGHLTPKEKQAVKDALADGTVSIAIGTHALIQVDVTFKDLAMAVIDEQHRFGVRQRLSLAEKGRGVDLLLMTATPIPRTMVLAAYGDLAVSFLREKPAGRKPITTRVMPLDRLDEVAQGLERILARGERIYWVCPLVEESEVLDFAAAQERFLYLQARFGNRVGLVHGQMPDLERDAAMAQFRAGTLDILVATTVIEVGVDVPEATTMVIENAQQFGLSQLHQLRGRIGRSDLASACVLLYGQPLSDVGKARLKIMRETNDGFLIAEEDLRLRGGGDILGTKQSGLPDFKFADPFFHGDLLETAAQQAQHLVAQDPGFTQNPHLKILLHLFEKEQALRQAMAG